MVAVGGFGLAAPNLAHINSKIGPSANIYRVSLIYTLMLAIGLLLVGRLSDLFGRRVRLSLMFPFLSCSTLTRLSNFLVLLHRLSGAVAKNVGMMIGGTALIGLAASGQQSFAFITGELVPMKVGYFRAQCSYPVSPS